MKELIFLSSVFLLLLSVSLASGTISCSKCDTSNCSCVITDCQSGVVDVYSSPFCSGNPSFELDFSNGDLNWEPGSNNVFYLLALCDDGKTQSSCTRVSLKSETTTTPRTTTPITTAAKPSQGPTTFTVVALIVVVLLALAFVIYFLFSRKGSKTTYDELQKKYRGYR